MCVIAQGRGILHDELREAWQLEIQSRVHDRLKAFKRYIEQLREETERYLSQGVLAKVNELIFLLDDEMSRYEILLKESHMALKRLTRRP